MNKTTNKCLICGTNKRPLVRDHDHRTGYIRGILCNRCNSWIGLFENGCKIRGLAIRWVKTYHTEICTHLSRNTGIKYAPVERLRTTPKISTVAALYREKIAEFRAASK